ncbi:MAG: Fic family protein [Anaerovoracaceae bacterium]
MNLRLSGSSLRPEDIDTVLQGGCILSAPIEEHLMITRLEELRQYIYRLSDMEADLSLQMIRDMHTILSGSTAKDFRKGNPVLLEYGASPLLPGEIPGEMAGLVNFARKREEGENLFLKAARLHNRCMEIYPYSEKTPELARAILYYTLVRNGLPMAALELSEEEYNQEIAAYLAGGGSQPLADHLMHAVRNRLELMVQLTGR